MRRGHLVGALAVAMCLSAVPAVPAVAEGVTETTDTISIVKEGETPSNVDLAVDLLTETPLSPDRVLLGRDDVFVDSMAAGVLQAESPLLLTPPSGPVPDQVLDALASTGASRVTLLGGDQALEPSVEAELVAAGYAVDRRAGLSRFETAVAIARDAGPSDTAILARAFESEGATDPTQAFADSLAAGYMAAENGWPILLTETDVLSGPTRDHLAERSFDRVLVLGGTAAVSDAVVAEVAGLAGTVDRIAGPDRFSTAVEIVKETGADSADDVARLTLVEGQGADAWAGGFAAAAHAALFDAPIVLTTGSEVPPATEDWLAGGSSFAQAPPDGIRLTCVTPFAACAEGRAVLGLPPTVDVTFDPPTGSAVPGDGVVVVSGAPADAVASGSCVAEPGAPLPTGGAVQLAPPEAGPCEVVVTFDVGGGVQQVETATYVDAAGPVLVSAGPDGAAVGGDHADVSDDGRVVAFLSDGDPTGQGITGTHVYARIDEEVVLVDVTPTGSPAAGDLLPGADVAPRVVGESRYAVVFASPDPALDADGAQGDPTGTNVYVRDLANGSTRLVSYDLAGEPVADASFGRASRDGRTVTYTGEGAASPSGGSSRHVFVHRQFNGQTYVVPAADGSAFDNAQVGAVELSADGSTLVLSSPSPDLVEGDGNARPDVFAMPVADPVVELVSVTDDGVQGPGEAPGPATAIGVSGDGALVVFTSSADLTGDGGTGPDVFLRDRHGGTTTLVSAVEEGVPMDAAAGPSVSDDGRYLAFASATPPGGAAAVDGCGIYRLDTQDGVTARVDVAADGTANGGSCSVPTTAVGRDGTVAFTSGTDLVPADADGDVDVYVSG